MNPKLKNIWKHMLDLGLGALAHANRHAAYAPMENHRWPERVFWGKQVVCYLRV